MLRTHVLGSFRYGATTLLVGRTLVHVKLHPSSTRYVVSGVKASAAQNGRTVANVLRTYATAAEAAKPTVGDRPAVNIELGQKDGSSTQVLIHPSYPYKPKAVQNLLASLPKLLTSAGMPTSRIRSFSSEGWDLDESNDTIHRYVELNLGKDHANILKQIKEAAVELKHDPHIHIDGPQVTISCTTHVPPGLSMKDVKLASKINEILREIGQDQSMTTSSEADILTQRQRGREHNMEAIRKAKIDCGCE